MTQHDRDQIEMAAAGCVSGSLADWPLLAGALRRLGLDLPGSTEAWRLRNLCEVIIATVHVAPPKPSCFNRPPIKASRVVQDGWFDAVVDGQATHLPRMVEIPDPMSKGCQQHSPLGEATLHGWDCTGCQWAPDREVA